MTTDDTDAGDGRSAKTSTTRMEIDWWHFYVVQWWLTTETSGEDSWQALMVHADNRN